jgi:hypothetical protein
MPCENQAMTMLVNSFLKEQPTTVFAPTTLDNNEYLRLIARQVHAFLPLQDRITGAIIDPVYKIEWQYSTPCYALSVGLLAYTGYLHNDTIIRSGIKALDCAVNEMYENRCAHHHGEFFIQPIMLALDLYKGIASTAQITVWKEKLSTINPYLLYRDNLRRKKTCYNHNVVALSGEWLRIKAGIGDQAFFNRHLTHQEQYLSSWGLYIDNKSNPPMVYDEFTRQFLTSILAEGYRGECFPFYSRKLYLGAWTSLFMQSPCGEVPTGGRSAQHIWNEAAAAVTYELYASQYAKVGRMAEAGAFKRAAHLSLKSIGRWCRNDGSGYIVKNRFPIKAMHGYESYSAQSQYNLLACWLMTVAYLYADNDIVERPAPADVGGYVLIMDDVFHKVFANAQGYYVEYELSGDPRYNATGLIRIHAAGGNPQIGPSDAIPHKWDNKQKKDLGGELYAVGPGWVDTSGDVHRLAEYTNLYYADPKLYSAYQSATPPQINVQAIKCSTNEVAFEVSYTGSFNGVHCITQRIIINRAGITVHDRLEGSIKQMFVTYPMLTDDGSEQSCIQLKKNQITIQLRDGKMTFTARSPRSAVMRRKGERLYFRNGFADIATFDVIGQQAIYRISQSSK